MTSVSNRLNGLYVITNHQNFSDENLVDDVLLAIQGGAKIIQYRDKSLSQDKRLRQAHKLSELSKQHDVIFIVNDDIDLARAVKADGVHLGGEDESIESARSKLGTNAIIGVSCYNQFELALTAQQQGASYAAFGRFFQSSTKPGEIYASVDLLQQAHKELNIPIVAIGGISYENAAPLIQAGADMIAVVNGVFGQDDIKLAAHQFQHLFNQQDS
jgi:thiamine-phosphate pyrophosphorylase